MIHPKKRSKGVFVLKEIKKKMFTDEIIDWYTRNKRELPWRETQDAYKIWLSEIILQQTRVNQGLPYYVNFVDKFPDVFELANAPIDDVLKLWQGLGYYSRARNMHLAAKKVVADFGGKFPDTYEKLLKLQGIGKYTAAAIASIAYNEAVAVVDGNVYRVLARYFGIDTPIDSTEGIKTFNALANEILEKENPAIYNQAIMEFGALYCKPQNPDCQNCIFSTTCKAFADKTVNLLPVKSKKTSIKKRYFNYLYFDKPGFTYLQKRLEKDIWAGLYEFPLLETEKPVINKNQLKNTTGFEDIVERQNIRFIKKSFQTVHKLSHRDIEAVFWHIGVDVDFLIKNSRIFEIKIDTLHGFGVSRLTDRFLNEYLDKQTL